jgi:hypothetical protein
MTLPAKKKLTTTMTVYELPIHANLSEMATSTRRAALYVRVSTNDRARPSRNYSPCRRPLGGLAGRSTATTDHWHQLDDKPPGPDTCSRAWPGASSTVGGCSANSSEP